MGVVPVIRVVDKSAQLPGIISKRLCLDGKSFRESYIKAHAICPFSLRHMVGGLVIRAEINGVIWAGEGNLQGMVRSICPNILQRSSKLTHPIALLRWTQLSRQFF